MHNSKRFSFLIVFSLSLLLAACRGAATPGLSPAATLAQATAAPLPTATLAVPSLTPTVLPTSSPTLQPSPTITFTPAPTADLALSQVKLTGVSWLPDYNFMLIFQFPAPVDPKNYRATLETKEYKCQVVAQYPNRLFCTGRGAAVESMAWVRLYQVGSDQPGFEQYTWIPYFTVEHK